MSYDTRDGKEVMADFTPTQGRYLGFILAYTHLHGYPPAESEIAAAMCVSPPSVSQMVKSLEKRGLILRHPGQSRSIKVLVSEDEIPPWNARKKATHPYKQPRRISAAPAAPPANLYVVSVFLVGGPVSDKFVNKEVSRVIEIRGDQTLEQLHDAIFKAYDRSEEHPYEFQFGKRPFDPDGPNYGVPSPQQRKKKKGYGDARTTKLDDLDLNPERVFGYWFDFGDDWFHQVQVERIEQAIPTVTYPRVIRRVGKSPPQYRDE
ncbi:MAG TPA: MarR family transcriptional regulator [Gemmataceae bacterium]|nr:MarR family transcriptional regulator [Gemmataceae bacterium]